ncbi:hypothetical protein D3C72_1800400 [compost metagenome]
MGAGGKPRQSEAIGTTAQFDIGDQRVNPGLEKPRGGARAAGGQGLEAQLGQLVDEIEQQQGLILDDKNAQQLGHFGSPRYAVPGRGSRWEANRCMRAPHG